MAETCTVTLRIDADTRRCAEEVFKEMGLTASQAIALFYKEVLFRGRLPFAPHVPNETTVKAIEEAQDRDRLARFDSPGQLFEDLGI